MNIWRLLFANCFAVIFMCLISASAKGAHIIGGDVTYTCVSIDSANQRSTYAFVLTVYRDTKGGGASFDSAPKIGVYRGGGFSWNFVQSFTTRVADIKDITFSNDPCIIIPSDVGVEKGVYNFEITLPWINESYKIAYQRCCRNGTITNIAFPGEAGAVFDVDILPLAQRSCNNSPVFNNLPPIVICAGEPLSVDQGVTDKDGDQLLYEFCAPQTAGGTDGATTPGDAEGCTGVTPDPERCPPAGQTVVFLAPQYTVAAPLGGNNSLVIDPLTGLLTGIPQVVGQYVVGVCVKEFRNGVLIGEIRRDFQFNVNACEIAVKANIDPVTDGVTLENVTNKSFTLKSCGSQTLFIKNKSKEERNINGYLWEIEIGGQTVSQTTKDGNFEFPGLGTYLGRMILNPGSTSCSDTADLVVNIFPKIEADFSFVYDSCVAGLTTFTDLSTAPASTIMEWQWQLADQGNSTDQNVQFEFESPGTLPIELKIKDENNCIDSIIKDILYYPAPETVVIDPSQFIGCKPASIFFQNLSSPINEEYTILWKFSDGTTSSDLSPTHVFEEAGIYDVRLEIISPLGCAVFREYPQLIEVRNKPIADFSYSPEQPSSFRREVNFTDLSVNAVAWFWNFSGDGAAFEPNPTYTFSDTGMYKVDLVVVHPEGCTDTATQLIDVIPLVTIHMPNAFTPNNDGLNDTYSPVGVFDGISDFSMKIWNRWGALVYESDSFLKGWNGEFNNSGTLSPQGNYVYSITYKGARGELKNDSGNLQLIR